MDEKNLDSPDPTTTSETEASSLSGDASVVGSHVQCRRFYEDLPGLFRCIDCGAAS